MWCDAGSNREQAGGNMCGGGEGSGAEEGERESVYHCWTVCGDVVGSRKVDSCGVVERSRRGG